MFLPRLMQLKVSAKGFIIYFLPCFLMDCKQFFLKTEGKFCWVVSCLFMHLVYFPFPFLHCWNIYPVCTFHLCGRYIWAIIKMCLHFLCEYCCCSNIWRGLYWNIKKCGCALCCPLHVEWEHFCSLCFMFFLFFFCGYR